jgi:hypothetical protein
MGREIAERGMELVYGGANVGLMGALAEATLHSGGRVVGVMPDLMLRKEIVHRGLTELRIVGSMHERKKIMSELGEGFIALPGGCGTLEEWFQALTWAQLGNHRIPCALLNVEHYFDPVLALLRKGCDERFIRREYLDMVICGEGPGELLDAMERYSPPTVEKWLDLEKV